MDEISLHLLEAPLVPLGGGALGLHRVACHRRLGSKAGRPSPMACGSTLPDIPLRGIKWAPAFAPRHRPAFCAHWRCPAIRRTKRRSSWLSLLSARALAGRHILD